MSEESTAGRPPVRTFKPRRRPLSLKRAELFERLEPRWCVAEAGEPFDAVEAFGRSAPFVLDIGIGFGDTTTTMAAADPSRDVIGCDVHTPGIASSLARIESMGLTNVRLLHGDALQFMSRLDDGSVSVIRIYFPDPWPKARHRHRRMTSEENIERFVRLLVPGGELHVATDIEDYALQTKRVCDAHVELRGGVIDRPDWRPITRYEQRGLDQGRSATDLVYLKAEA